ncbi:MAG TPA: type IV pilus modification protein PilV [Gammaproteobacteria bacterium]|nr:type IV pilus modification protein PilV [Gammaproteobacteria bacterium]
MRPTHKIVPCQSGFSLLEVLISLVVLSVGLLGIAGLETAGMRMTYNGSVWSAAAISAQNMVDKMRANPGCINNGATITSCTSTGGVIGGNYDAVTAAPSGTIPTCSSACTSSDVATLDKSNWYSTLSTNLPSGTGSVMCVTPNYCDQANYVSQAVYVITICWDDGISGAPAAGCGSTVNSGTVIYTSPADSTYQVTVLPALP